VWRVDTPDGRKQYTKSGFPTRKEAQAFLNETLAAIQGGVFSQPTKITFGEYLTDRWLPARQMSLRPSTYASYRASINLHVIPELGSVKLQQLSPDRLDRFYAGLVAAEMAAKTVRNIHVMIHRALRDAVRKNLLARNVADAADPPKLNRADREEMKTWTPQQLRLFLAGIAEHRLSAAYTLAATTGMRRGEVLGLRWKDINFRGHELQVRQTVLSIEYKLTFGGPKTLRGQRRISLDPETIRVLTTHRAAQRHEKRLLGAGYHDHDLVFAREDGTPVHPDYFSQTFDRTVKRLKLPKIRLHDLRHTHATLGLGAGIHIKVISDRLGHATTAFTMDIYTHAIPTLKDEAANQIADIVFGEDDDQVDGAAPTAADDSDTDDD